MISDFIEHALKTTPKKERTIAINSPKSSSTQDSSFDKKQEKQQTDDALETLLASFEHKILIHHPVTNRPFKDIDEIKGIFDPEWQQTKIAQQNYLAYMNQMALLQQKQQYLNYNYLQQLQIEENFQINQDNILNDERTTLMIKNVPKSMTSTDLQNRLNRDYKDQYDFIYMPYDTQVIKFNCHFTKQQTNMGYAFVNFSSPQAVKNFFEKYHNQKWSHNNQEKICQLRYAKLQGKRDLINQLSKHCLY